MAADLFRKTAMDNMSTPEQLDQQVKIMRPATWIIYIALVVGFAVFVLWAMTYQMTNGIRVSGVVFTNSDIQKVTAQRDVVIKDVIASEGDHIEIGDIIAVISNDKSYEEISSLRFQMESMDQQSNEYKAAQIRLNALIDKYTTETVIKSSYSGYVQSIKMNGSAIAAGDTIASIMADEASGGFNEIIAYVPMQTARNLELGMDAQISPNYAPREEYGYMTGVVTAISEVPVTEESIQRHMGTLSYVENMLPETASVEVRIKLNLDAGSKNSYEWSNPKGEGLSVELGTACNITIITREQRPIDLLLGDPPTQKQQEGDMAVFRNILLDRSLWG